MNCKPLPPGYCNVSVDVIEKGDVELPYPHGIHLTVGEVGMDLL